MLLLSVKRTDAPTFESCFRSRARIHSQHDVDVGEGVEGFQVLLFIHMPSRQLPPFQVGLDHEAIRAASEVFAFCMPTSFEAT